VRALQDPEKGTAALVSCWIATTCSCSLRHHSLRHHSLHHHSLRHHQNPLEADPLLQHDLLSSQQVTNTMSFIFKKVKNKHTPPVLLLQLQVLTFSFLTPTSIHTANIAARALQLLAICRQFDKRAFDRIASVLVHPTRQVVGPKIHQFCSNQSMRRNEVM
jgi:hypothetical protein